MRQQLQENQVNISTGSVGTNIVNAGTAYSYETVTVDAGMNASGIINFPTLRYFTSNAERGKHLEIYVDGLRKLPDISGFTGDYIEQPSAILINDASYITFHTPPAIGAKVTAVMGGIEVFTRPFNTYTYECSATETPGYVFTFPPASAGGIEYMSGGGYTGRGLEIFCNGIRLYHGYEYNDQATTGLNSACTTVIFNDGMASGSVYLFQTAMPGASGDSGTDGNNGITGPQGPVGPAGPQGPQGIAGNLGQLVIPIYVNDVLIANAAGTDINKVINYTSNPPLTFPNGNYGYGQPWGGVGVYAAGIIGAGEVTINQGTGILGTITKIYGTRIFITQSYVWVPPYDPGN